MTLKPDLLPNELLAAEKADSPFSEGGIEDESTLKLAGILAVSEYCRHGGSVEKLRRTWVFLRQRFIIT